MKRVVTRSEMKELDAHTIHDIGVPSAVLMERAALALAAQIEKEAGRQERILIVCGSGNNGGDGIAAARLLHIKGFRVDLYLVGNSRKYTAETSLQLKIAKNYHVPVVEKPDWSAYGMIVDSIFGVGLTRPVEGHYREILEAMNQAKAKKIAADIPSGLDGSSGRVLGIAFRADVTVAFAFLKQGMCFYPGRSLAGRVIVADIGIGDIPYEYGQPVWALEKEDMKLLPERVPWGHKGTFGKVLLVAGTKGMCGAAYFSASAALNTGAGMVRVQTEEENRLPLHTLLPEAIVETEFSEEKNAKLLDWCDVIVIGPGLGEGEQSRKRAEWFLRQGSRQKKPIILDADGLNLLSVNPQWEQYLNKNTMLTPHIGEMSRLTHLSIRQIKENPTGVAAELSKKMGAVCVLKDAGTVIAGPDGALYINLSGNPGMAAAGSGDVLSGMLAGVCCMYLSSEENPDTSYKAAMGVYLHGLCGNYAAGKIGTRGMKARDILKAIPLVLKEFETGSKEIE